VKHVAFLLVAFLLWAGKAYAATVVFLWPPNPSAEVTQALTLLRGELLSVGLEVTMADRDAAHHGGEEDAVWLEIFANHGANAVIDPIGDDVLQAIDVWIVKTQPQRFEVAHVAADLKDAQRPEMLALRAVEALRASLLQMDWAARKRHGEAVPEPGASPTPPLQVQPGDPGERVGIEIGAAAIMSLDGLGPAVMPTVGVGWATRPWLIVQASAAGLGSRPTVANAAGSARVAQQFAVLGASYRFRPSQRLWPFFGLSAGALHTSVEGRTGLGTTGHNLGRWSALLDLSLGTGLRLYGRYTLTLAAHVQMAQPYVAIDIVDTVGATTGRPNLLLTLTVGAWL
jgi:hypothetical protein